MLKRKRETLKSAHPVVPTNEHISRQQTGSGAPYRITERRPFTPYTAIPRPKDFTPLNTQPERILKEVYETRLIPEPRPPQGPTMGTETAKWCKYHRVRGHDTDFCIHLRQEIETLIQNGKLRGYAQEGRGDNRKKADNKRNE